MPNSKIGFWSKLNSTIQLVSICDEITDNFKWNNLTGLYSVCVDMFVIELAIMESYIN